MINDIKNFSRMLTHIIALSLSFTVIAYPIDSSKRHTKKTPKYYDNKPSNVTNKDMSIVKNFDNIAYEITERNAQHINIAKIYNFIIKNKSYIHDYNRLMVNATGRIGSRTRRQLTQDYNYDFQDSRKFYSAYIEVSYPLFDRKHQKTINNEKVKYNLDVLQKVEEYASACLDVMAQKELLEFLRMKQRLVKTEAKAGIKYRDDRITLLDKMMSIKMKLRLSIDKRDSMRIYLLNLTNDPQGLRGML